MKLTEFELDSIRIILEREKPNLLKYLSQLSVSSRKDYGGSRVITFCEIWPNIGQETNLVLGEMLYCEVQGMGYGLGFLLFVDGGAPAALEIFSHCNEAIPEHISFYEHIWSCFPNCASVTHVMGTA